MNNEPNNNDNPISFTPAACTSTPIDLSAGVGNGITIIGSSVVTGSIGNSEPLSSISASTTITYHGYAYTTQLLLANAEQLALQGSISGDPVHVYESPSTLDRAIEQSFLLVGESDSAE